MDNPNIIIEIAKQAFKEGLKFRLHKKFLVGFCQEVADTHTLELKEAVNEVFVGAGLFPNEPTKGTIWAVCQDATDENLWLMMPAVEIKPIYEASKQGDPLPVLPFNESTTQGINKWVMTRSSNVLVIEAKRGELMYAILYALGMNDDNKHRYLVAHETSWPEFKTHLVVKVLAQTSADIDSIPMFFTIAKGVRDAEYVQHGFETYNSKANKERLLAKLEPFDGRFWNLDQPVMEGVKVEEDK